MDQTDVLDSLWVEKYRPKSLDTMAMMPAYREKFAGFIRDGMIPHLLLEGPAGSGKTTSGRVLIDSMSCEALKMNASDERGIDVIRGKVRNFAQVATFKKFKIVLLDEADALTEDAQNALKNIMETYSKITRFILTCNTVSLITDPILSRCQTFHFNAMPKTEMKSILTGILENEKIGFDPDDLDKHIEQFYPDLRKCINSLQLHVQSGKFVFIDEAETVRKLTDLMLNKDMKGIRALLSTKRGLVYSDLYRRIYDHIDMFDKSARLQILLDAAEYLWRDSAIVDKEMNFVAFCVKIMPLIKKV